MGEGESTRERGRYENSEENEYYIPGMTVSIAGFDGRETDSCLIELSAFSITLIKLHW